MANQERGRAKRARLQRAAERLYEDSRLRNALTDEEAQRLLSWAYGRLEKAVEGTQGMPEEEAMPVVEERSETVRSVVRRVNAIMGQFSQAAEEERSVSLARFAEALRQVEKRAEQREDVPAAEAPTATDAAEMGPEEMDRETLFRRLMHLLTTVEEAE